MTRNPELRKVYIRHREGYPESEVQDYARRGFWLLGVETVPYEWGTDIDQMDDLGPEVGVAGYVGDVRRALVKLGVQEPENIDYPKPLQNWKYYRRALYLSTLGEIRIHPGAPPAFIKPSSSHKLFTGFVYDGGEAARRNIVSCEDDVEVWVSQPVNFLAEYRVFILDHEILDCRRYKGDWHIVPSRKIIEEAVALMAQWERTPRAYSLDFGVVAQGKRGRHTVLVEMNDAFALGHYGLTPALYARMLSARWHELASGPPQNKEQGT